MTCGEAPRASRCMDMGAGEPTLTSGQAQPEGHPLRERIGARALWHLAFSEAGAVILEHNARIEACCAVLCCAVLCCAVLCCRERKGQACLLYLH